MHYFSNLKNESKAKDIEPNNMNAEKLLQWLVQCEEQNSNADESEISTNEMISSKLCYDIIIS